MNKLLRIMLYTLVTIVLTLIAGITFSTSFRTKMINTWFEVGMYAGHSDEDLHKYSQWIYLSSQEFSEIVRDGISRLNKPLTNENKIFEMGVGVGATLKVIKEDYPRINIGGSDFSAGAIAFAKNTFPNYQDQFFTHDMTKKHDFIPDNTFDCVLSFGALAMYLTEEEMILAIKDALRMTKPGGSLLLTHFIEPNAHPRGSIVTPIQKDYWVKVLPDLGGTNIKIYPMLHQGDRYQVSFSKK